MCCDERRLQDRRDFAADSAWSDQTAAHEFYDCVDEHFGWAESAKNKRERAIFLQRAVAWLEVAQQWEADLHTDLETTDSVLRMERTSAIRLLRALLAVGLRQRESMADAAIRSVAVQAGLDKFDAAHQHRAGSLKPEKRSRRCSLRSVGGPQGRIVEVSRGC